MTKIFILFISLFYSFLTLRASDCPELNGTFMCSAVGEEREKRAEAIKDMESFFDISTKKVSRKGIRVAIYKINGKNFLENSISKQGFEGIQGKRLTCKDETIFIESMYVFVKEMSDIVQREGVKRALENGEHSLDENLYIKKIDDSRIDILEKTDDSFFKIKLECLKV